ncbi:MAG TPA: hypothetical protein ENN40_06180 [Candidatus Aminicenantes bacterium]|nr:hypothetical protein [Candidatus Aminicenantes bacterium]
MSPGQRVRIYVTASDPGTAEKVKLEETQICGTVLSLDTAMNRLTLQVARSSKLDVSVIPGFTNPVTAEFPDGLPMEAAVDIGTELEGHYNRLNPGIFAVNKADFFIENEDDLEEDGEPTWVGLTYSLISRSPLKFHLTRGAAEDPTGHRTVTVTADTGTTILSKHRNVTEQITASALADGIQAGEYHMIKARGTYNASARTLQATLIPAMIRP